MKIGIVYTATTNELIEYLNNEIKKQIGDSLEVCVYEDASILADVREKGFVSKQPARKLINLYLKAVEDDCVAILNVCSSVSEVSDSFQNMADFLGVPVVRIDEDMCKSAIRVGARIGVMATLKTTLEPTKNTLKRLARSMGKEIILVDALVDAFSKSQDEFKALLTDKALEIKGEVDVIVLCQGSMAYSCAYISEKTDIKVLESPSFGVNALKNKLIEIGAL